MPRFLPRAMPHRKSRSPEAEFNGCEPGTVLLSTEIGHLKASWETCHSRFSTEANPAPAVDILKCLGIPYAKVPYRWAAPRREASPWQEVKDCTKFGPQCPQANDVLFNIDGLPVFGSNGKGSVPVQSVLEDEFHCLNLNIFAPMDIVRGRDVSISNLPVLLWIHGGAYWTGTAGVDLYGKRQCRSYLSLANKSAQMPRNWLHTLLR
jgi:acetyl esterase/lipase